MLFDISPFEVAFLAVLGVILLGPEKLPKLIGEAVRFLRKLREYSDSATREIREELGPEFKDLDVRDLNPRTFAGRKLAEHSEELGFTEIQELRRDIAPDETRDPPWPAPPPSPTRSPHAGGEYRAP
jgi:sec-independent protein translocase protein TatB